MEYSRLRMVPEKQRSTDTMPSDNLFNASLADLRTVIHCSGERGDSTEPAHTTQTIR